MIEASAVTLRWLGLGLLHPPGRRRPTSRDHVPLRVACPHCTNVDTLSRHCTNGACRWVSCTCGALVYNRRRHRHPRHGSERDTCHDPTAAV